MKEMRAGDAGTIMETTIHNDKGGIVAINLATLLEMTFIDPNGAKFTKTAAFSTDGKDGRLKYVSMAADFMVPGKWGMQAHVVMPSADFHSSMDQFLVQATFE
jgi:hypothetical protein